jgi:hypothetical protein
MLEAAWIQLHRPNIHQFNSLSLRATESFGEQMAGSQGLAHAAICCHERSCQHGQCIPWD